MWNPPNPGYVGQILRPPTRLVATGTLTLTNGSTDTYTGSDKRQSRIQIIVTNLDATNSLTVCTSNGVPATTIFPQQIITLETDDVVCINNASGSSINYQVLELYPNTGNQNGNPRPLNRQGTAGGGSGGTGGTGAGGSGGTGGTYSGGSRGGFLA